MTSISRKVMHIVQTSYKSPEKGPESETSKSFIFTLLYQLTENRRVMKAIYTGLPRPRLPHKSVQKMHRQHQEVTKEKFPQNNDILKT